MHIHAQRAPFRVHFTSPHSPYPFVPAEKLSEYLKVFRYPSICCEVLLTFKILLLRISPHHLMAFWPAMTAELASLRGRGGKNGG